MTGSSLSRDDSLARESNRRGEDTEARKTTSNAKHLGHHSQARAPDGTIAARPASALKKPWSGRSTLLSP